MAAPTSSPPIAGVSSTAALGAASANYPQWATDFLNGIGAPLSDTNYQALLLWEQAEGGVPQNNPLNASGQGAGATSCIAQCGSSSPIYAYDTIANGVAHDVQFLQNNNYAGVIGTFQQNAGLGAIWAAINQSGWCRGCNGGKYPSTLYDALNATPAQLQSFISTALGDAAKGAAIAGVPGAGAVAGAISAASTVGGLISDITSRAFWMRVGEGALGVALIVVGLIVFISTTEPGKDAIKVGETAAVAA